MDLPSSVHKTHLGWFQSCKFNFLKVCETCCHFCQFKLNTTQNNYNTAVYSGTLIWHLAQIGLNLRFNFINRAQCRTLLTVLWQQQHFKMSTKYECDKGSRKNGRNPFATSHDCHFMHISSFTQTLRNRVGTLGITNASFWRGLVGEQIITLHCEKLG